MQHCLWQQIVGPSQHVLACGWLVCVWPPRLPVRCGASTNLPGSQGLGKVSGRRWGCVSISRSLCRCEACICAMHRLSCTATRAPCAHVRQGSMCSHPQLPIRPCPLRPPPSTRPRRRQHAEDKGAHAKGECRQGGPCQRRPCPSQLWPGGYPCCTHMHPPSLPLTARAAVWSTTGYNCVVGLFASAHWS